MNKATKNTMVREFSIILFLFLLCIVLYHSTPIAMDLYHQQFITHERLNMSATIDEYMKTSEFQNRKLFDRVYVVSAQQDLKKGYLTHDDIIALRKYINTKSGARPFLRYVRIKDVQNSIALSFCVIYVLYLFIRFAIFIKRIWQNKIVSFIKQRPYAAGAICAFTMSFMIHRYYIQFIVLAVALFVLSLGLKKK